MPKITAQDFQKAVATMDEETLEMLVSNMNSYAALSKEIANANKGEEPLAEGTDVLSLMVLLDQANVIEERDEAADYIAAVLTASCEEAGA